jgi:hypothetical protein
MQRVPRAPVQPRAGPQFRNLTRPNEQSQDLHKASSLHPTRPKCRKNLPRRPSHCPRPRRHLHLPRRPRRRFPNQHIQAQLQVPSRRQIPRTRHQWSAPHPPRNCGGQRLDQDGLCPSLQVGTDAADRRRHRFLRLRARHFLQFRPRHPLLHRPQLWPRLRRRFRKPPSDSRSPICGAASRRSTRGSRTTRSNSRS